jgi:hypothetical protein
MRLSFKTKGETMTAMALTEKWLKELILRTERGIEALGLVIEKKYMAKFESGDVEPAISVKSLGGKWTVELYLGNTLAEFLTLDRSANPQKLDVRLFIDAFAEYKLNDLVKSRLAIVEAMVTSRSAKDVRKKIEKIAPGYAHIRMWEPLKGRERGHTGKK